MELGFLTAPYANQSLEDTVKLLRSRYDANTLQALELGTGNYPPNGHCNPDIYLCDREKQRELLSLLSDNGFELSALSCHGNPVHPLEEIARAHHSVQDKTIKLAGEFGVKTVVCFSGLHGDDIPGRSKSKIPIWVTNP